MAKTKISKKIIEVPSEFLIKKEVYTVICPGCGKNVETHRCKFCGAEKIINQVSGNEIWMRNGRVVSAFVDSKTAYVAMATRYGIPEDQWIPEFKEEKK